MSYDNWLMGPVERASVEVTCPHCEETSEVEEVSELGTSWLEPEACPECGEDFDL